MRGSPTAFRLCAGALVLASAATACSSGSASAPASPSEAAVCEATQRMFDGIVGGAVPTAQEQAIAGLADLLTATQVTDNPQLAGAGDRLGEVVGTQVDPGGFTVEQTADYGRRLGVAGAAALDEILLECERLDLPVEGLDQIPVDDLDRQIVEEYRGATPEPPSTSSSTSTAADPRGSEPPTPVPD